MTGPVFVDANVFVSAYDAADPAKSARARAWLQLLWRERSGRTSMQVLAEYYVNAARKLRPGVAQEVAWEDVKSYFTWKPLPIDEPLLRHARDVEQRWRLSWWDSMIVAAAQLQDCTVLLTEDLHEGMLFGALRVRSPFSAALEEPRAHYDVEKPRPLHRPRGRPKRIASGA